MVFRILVDMITQCINFVLATKDPAGKQPPQSGLSIGNSLSATDMDREHINFVGWAMKSLYDALSKSIKAYDSAAASSVLSKRAQENVTCARQRRAELRTLYIRKNEHSTCPVEYGELL